MSTARTPIEEWELSIVEVTALLRYHKIIPPIKETTDEDRIITVNLTKDIKTDCEIHCRKLISMSTEFTERCALWIWGLEDYLFSIGYLKDRERVYKIDDLKTFIKFPSKESK